MKYIVALCLLGVALAAPQQRDQKLFKILRSDTQPVDGANFRYSYETENGIVAEKQGTAGSQGQSNMAGSFRFPLPDGTIAEFRYVADENGYRVESPLIPTPHPLPAHAVEQIRFAEAERARKGRK